MNSFRRVLMLTSALLLCAGLVAAPAATAKKKKQPSLNVIRASSTSPGAPGPGTLSATATCPSGTQALGGGFVHNAAVGASPPLSAESVRAGDGAWRASMVPSNYNQSVTAEVYCARVKGTITDVTGTASLPATALSIAATQATCPTNTRLISGGYATSEPSGSPYAYVFESRRLGQNGWQAQVLRSNDVPAAAPFTVHAYCFKPSKPKAKGKAKPRKRVILPRPLTEVVATATVGGTQFSPATATTGPCGGRRKGISGGFSAPAPSPAGVAAIEAGHYVGETWNVGAIQATDGNPVTFTAYEYCA